MSQESNQGRGRGGRFSGGGRRGGILGSTVRKVAGGIGLASESISAYKENKKNEKQAASTEQNHSAQAAPNVPSASGSTAVEYGEQVDEDDLTEMQWQYDAEVQIALLAMNEGMAAPPYTSRTDEEIAAGFIRGYDFVHGAYPQAPPRLELPVILAQRRPNDRSRGFVRAYAPMLEDVGIDQKMWLEFLSAFDQSTQASPWIKALNLANIPGLLIPIGPGIAVSVAIDMTIKAAQNTQSKQKTNKFLDKMNKEFFNPKGLACVVMTWKPDSGQSQEVVSTAATVAASMDSYNSGITNKFKSSSGKTYGDFALPEAAPLIFPTSSEQAVSSEEAKGWKQSMGKKKDFVDNYYDKRAQSEFANNSPDNILNQHEKQEYSSRYADPNHASNNGSIISLVSGGYVKPPRLLGGVGGRGRGSRGGRGGRGGMDGAGRGRGPLPFKPVSSTRKFFLKQDVLYLMVVNMPSQEELDQARDVMSSA